MGSVFKVGDSALTLIQLPVLPAGSVVVLEKKIWPGDNLASEQRPIIAIAEGWWCRHSDVGSGLPFAEKSLMPLRGDFASEPQKTTEVEA